MADTTIAPEVVMLPTKKTSRVKSFIGNYPRTAKVLGITAVALAVAGVVITVKNAQDADSVDTDATEGEIQSSPETA